MSTPRADDEILRVQMLGTRGLPNRYGGAETCVEEVGSRLAARGHEVRVFCRTRVTGSRDRRYRGMELIDVPSVPIQVLDTVSHSTLSLIWLLLRTRREPRRIVHFLSGGNGVVLPLARLFGLPTVVTVDGPEWQREKWGPIAQRLLRAAFWLTSKFADVVVADSREMQKRLGSEARTSVLYVPYGIPEVPEAEAAEHGTLSHLDLEHQGYVLFVGRFVPEKGIVTLIRAHGQMKRPRPKLVLVGGTPDESVHAQQLASEASDDVVFAGPLFGAALEPLLRSALAYVQPSVIEGTSPMLLTAMAHGLNVIASDIPENRETMGPNGRFFTSQNVASLCSLLEGLGEDPDEERQRANALRRHVANTYSWDSVTDDYLVAYRRALER